MNLGQFSLSLTVKDIRAAREFYQKLGFELHDDHEDQNWVILRQGNTVIGLFQGMFEKNLLTFHPADVRQVSEQLKAQGVTLDSEVNDAETGYIYTTLTDPDGNPILLDTVPADYTPTSAGG